MKFGTAPRFQKTFTTRTGLQGILLGGDRRDEDADRPRERQSHLPAAPAPPADAHAAEVENDAAEEAAPTDQSIHNQVVARLGNPVNLSDAQLRPYRLDEASAKTVRDGNAASWKILNAVKSLRRPPAADASHEDEESAYQELIHHAAAGAAARVGVCDNFASLGAVLAHTQGVEDVSTRAVLGHQTMIMGGRVVDPWTNMTHRPMPADAAARGGITSLSGAYPPARVQGDFREELAQCGPALEAVLAANPADAAAYRALLALREREGGFGTAASRESAHAAVEHEAVERQAQAAARAERDRRERQEQQEAAERAKREAAAKGADSSSAVAAAKAERAKRDDEGRAAMRAAMQKAKEEAAKAKKTEPPADE